MYRNILFIVLTVNYIAIFRMWQKKFLTRPIIIDLEIHFPIQQMEVIKYRKILNQIISSYLKLNIKTNNMLNNLGKRYLKI